MKFSLEPDHPNSIQSYARGQINIAGQAYTRPLVVSPDELRDNWEPSTLEAISVAHMQALLSLQPEIILLGTGSRLRFPPTEVSHCLIDRQIGIEVMDTAAACRTYNVLLSEDRRVVAALLMIGS